MLARCGGSYGVLWGLCRQRPPWSSGGEVYWRLLVTRSSLEGRRRCHERRRCARGEASCWRRGGRRRIGARRRACGGAANRRWRRGKALWLLALDEGHCWTMWRRGWRARWWRQCAGGWTQGSASADELRRRTRWSRVKTIDEEAVAGWLWGGSLLRGGDGDVRRPIAIVHV